MIGIGEMS